MSFRLKCSSRAICYAPHASSVFSPKFTITNQLLKNISHIEAAKSVIDNALLMPAWEVRFQKDAAARTIYYAAQFEGNDLSLMQAKKIVDYVDQRKSSSTIARRADILGQEKDIQELVNYGRVLKYIESLHDLHERAQRRFLYYKQSELKEVHRLAAHQILPKEKAGKYRDIRVVIKDSSTGEISFRPPPPVEVPYQLEHFFEWLNSLTTREVHPILRAGITHYELTRIHPFTDANGWAARVFAMLVLFKEGYDIKRFFSLEEGYNKDLSGYYRSLQKVSEKNGDLTSWLEYFTMGFVIELDKIRNRVEKLSFDALFRDKRGRQLPLSNRQIRIVKFLKKNVQIRMRDARVLLPRVSEDTILRDIIELIKKKIVVKRGRTKAASYMLREV